METVVWTDDGVLLTEQIQKLIMSIDLGPMVSYNDGCFNSTLMKEQKPKLECCCIVDGSEGVGRNSVFVFRAYVCVSRVVSDLPIREGLAYVAGLRGRNVTTLHDGVETTRPRR